MGKFLKWVAIIVGGLIVLVVVVSIISGNDSIEEVDPELAALEWDELKNMAESISYDELFRNNEQWEGRLVFYRSQIVQVLERSSVDYRLRANVTRNGSFWDDTVFLRYSGERLLEDDIIEFVGRVNGLLTYDAVLGNTVTIPYITIVQSRRM